MVFIRSNIDIAGLAPARYTNEKLRYFVLSYFVLCRYGLAMVRCPFRRSCLKDSYFQTCESQQPIRPNLWQLLKTRRRNLFSNVAIRSSPIIILGSHVHPCKHRQTEAQLSDIQCTQKTMGIWNKSVGVWGGMGQSVQSFSAVKLNEDFAFQTMVASGKAIQIAQ